MFFDSRIIPLIPPTQFLDPCERWCRLSPFASLSLFFWELVAVCSDTSFREGGLGNIWLPRAQQKPAGCHFTRSSMGFKRKPQNFTLWKTFTYQHTLTQKHWNQTKHGISPSCLTKSLYWYLEWVYHPSLPLSCYQRTRQLLSVILQKGGSWK